MRPRQSRGHQSHLNCVVVAVFFAVYILFRVVRSFKLSRMDTPAHGSNDMMMMPMWFTFTVDTILWFKQLHPNTWPTYIVSLLGLVAFGILHEALASYRITLAKAPKTPAAVQGYSPMPDSAPINARRSAMARLGASALYASNLTTGYLLMLAVMSYNAGIFIAVVLGMGIGHFIFCSKPWHQQTARMDTCCETMMNFDE